MSVLIPPTIWLDIVGVAAVIATFYLPIKDIFNRLRHKNREEKRDLVDRNRSLDSMLRDWTGEKAREGVPARLGVMARLGTIEKHLDVIDHEVTFNSGASIKDAVHRTDHAVEDLSNRFSEHVAFSEKFQIEVVKKL